MGENIDFYPGRFNGACSLVCLHCQRPSPCNSKVGSCNYFFGACSAFTHVTACTLAESPSDLLHRKLRQLRCLRSRLDATGSGRDFQPLKFSAFHGALLGQQRQRLAKPRVEQKECGVRRLRTRFYRFALSRDYPAFAKFDRSDRKPARTSSERSCGCSHAAKCPPLSSLL